MTMFLLQICRLWMNTGHSQANPRLGTQVLRIRPDPLAMKIQPVCVPTSCDGRISTAKPVAVLDTGFEKQLTLALGEILIDVLKLVETLPQSISAIPVAAIRTIGHAHGVVKQRIQRYDLQVNVRLHADQQLRVLPNTKPVIEPVKAALEDVQRVGLMQNVGNALTSDHGYSNGLAVDHQLVRLSLVCQRSREILPRECHSGFFLVP